MKIPQSRSGATLKSSPGIFNGWLALTACLALFPLSHASAIVDLDSDTLDDVWEERFNAQSALPGDDDDGDGHTNLEECIAGTDPYDPASCLALSSASAVADSTADLTFPTVDGKCYQVQIGNSTTGTGVFANAGPEFNGTGGDLTVSLSNSANTDTTGSATAELWMGITGTAIGSLTNDPNYPANPDATHALDSLQIESNVDNNYGGRVLGFIKAPDTGSYTFYISGRNQSEFWLSTDGDPANISRACYSFNGSITEGDYTKFSTQISASISLTAGLKYYFEIRHKHAGQEDFCSVAWDRPTTPPSTIEIVDGAFLCPFLTAPETDPIPALDGNSRKFARVVVKDLDQDGDGVTDWAEKQMQGEGNFHFADPDSTTAAAANDLVAVTNALGAGGETITVSVADGVAREDNRTSNQMNNGTTLANTPRNPARFRLNRAGSLQPVTVSYSLGGVALPDESGEPADYSEEDVNGAPLSGTANIPFGHVSCEIVLDPVRDGTHEYPEHVRLTVDPGAGYTVGANSTADVEISDAQDIPEQEILFVGRSTDEPGSVLPKGTAIVSGFVNGRKDFMRLNSLIMAGFSSPQNDSHIHKSNAGPLPGGVIYEITETPGDPGTDPFVGELLDYPWDIELAGGLTAQQIVDSLFNQDAQTPLYLNWHTNNNQSGELWAILGEETGTIDPPDPPPAPPAITPLAGADLEREVRRFLNQATFGATDATVYDMINNWIPAAGNDRIQAYSNWMDDQIDNIPQTWLVDQTLAADNQEWKLRGFFDPTRWNSPVPNGNSVPTLPASWPGIVRTNSNAGVSGGNFMVRFPPNNWYPNAAYPLTIAEISWGRNEAVYVPFDLVEPNHNNRRRAMWSVMLNGKDQLRQKMGYSLQQILVVAETLNRIRQNHIAAANYQDLMNYYAFEHFRDQFSWINWSPIMGKWLSSLKNQQAFDTSVPPDGIPDVFPDENLAREDMQLFSIGLLTLWRDGTLKLSATTGLPEPTYTNADITEFSRVLTGQSFSRYSAISGTQQQRAEQWGITGIDNGNPFDTDNSNGDSSETDGDDGILWNTDFNRAEGNKYLGHQFTYPMRMFGANHDPGVKTLAGGKVIDNTSDNNLNRRGRDDLEDAVTWFAGAPGSDSYDMATAHQSTPAFISLRLIQRLTKSNPSSAYLYRVADAFAQDGGNLRDTVKAILLDYEVRELALADSDTTTGLKKAPLDAYMQLARNFSQREDTPGVFVPGAYTSIPMNQAGAIPGGAPAPPADGYLENFAYPTAQANNFEINSRHGYGQTDNQLQMTPFAQATVFNFYLPLYSPGGPVANAGLLSPELQLATETNVIQNVNYFYTTTVNIAGQGLNTLGLGPQTKPSQYNQRLLYGDATPEDSHASDTYDNFLIDKVAWGENIITWEPAGTGVNTVAAYDDIVELVDAIDLRLMDGGLKAKYALDPGLRTSADTANDDGALDGVNETKTTTGDGNFNNDFELRNPREIIVKSLYDMTYNPYNINNPTNAQNSKRDLFRFALYLMAGTPEFIVHK